MTIPSSNSFDRFIKIINNIGKIIIIITTAINENESVVEKVPARVRNTIIIDPTIVNTANVAPTIAVYLFFNRSLFSSKNCSGYFI